MDETYYEPVTYDFAFTRKIRTLTTEVVAESTLSFQGRSWTEPFATQLTPDVETITLRDGSKQEDGRRSTLTLVDQRAMARRALEAWLEAQRAKLIQAEFKAALELARTSPPEPAEEHLLRAALLDNKTDAPQIVAFAQRLGLARWELESAVQGTLSRNPAPALAPAPAPEPEPEPFTEP